MSSLKDQAQGWTDLPFVFAYHISQQSIQEKQKVEENVLLQVSFDFFEDIEKQTG